MRDFNSSSPFRNAPEPVAWLARVMIIFRKFPGFRRQFKTMTLAIVWCPRPTSYDYTSDSRHSWEIKVPHHPRRREREEVRLAMPKRRTPAHNRVICENETDREVFHVSVIRSIYHRGESAGCVIEVFRIAEFPWPRPSVRWNESQFVMVGLFDELIDGEIRGNVNQRQWSSNWTLQGPAEFSIPLDQLHFLEFTWDNQPPQQGWIPKCQTKPAVWRFCQTSSCGPRTLLFLISRSNPDHAMIQLPHAQPTLPDSTALDLNHRNSIESSAKNPGSHLTCERPPKWSDEEANERKHKSLNMYYLISAAMQFMILSSPLVFRALIFHHFFKT